MAGNKTIYNSTAAECVHDLLIREQGSVFDQSLMIIDPPVCDATSCTVRLRSSTGESGAGLYFGRADYRYTKFRLSDRLPQDLTYSYEYPCSRQQFLDALASTFDILFEPSDLSLVTAAGPVPLTGLDYIGEPPDANNQLIFIVNNESGRWVGGDTFKIFVVDRTAAVWDPLVLTGDSPDGTVGEPYTGSYQASGGMPPYRYYVAAGNAPSVLDAQTGQFNSLVIRAGTMNWIVQAVDARGATVFLEDSAVIHSASLTILTDTLPDAVIGEQYTARVQAAGGALGYVYVLESGPDELKLSSDGRFSGVVNDDVVQVRVRVTDAIGQVATRTFDIAATQRTIQQIASSLLSKTVEWNDFLEPIDPATLLIPSTYRRADQTHSLRAVGNVRVDADGLHLEGGHVTSGMNLFKDVGVWLTYSTDRWQQGSAIVGRGTATQGWEVFNDIYGENILEFRVAIRGQRYTIRTDGAVPVYGQEPKHLFCERAHDRMIVAMNGEVLGALECPEGDISVAHSTQTNLGMRPSSTAYGTWQSNVRAAIYFDQRLWFDEIRYLYNNGQGRSYASVVADAS